MRQNLSFDVMHDFITTHFTVKPSIKKYPFAKFKSDIANICFVPDSKTRGKVNSLVWNWANVNYEQFQGILANGTFHDIIQIMDTHENMRMFCEHIKAPKVKVIKAKPRHILDIVLEDVHSTYDLYKILGMPFEEEDEKKVDSQETILFTQEVMQEVTQEDQVNTQEVTQVNTQEVTQINTQEVTQDTREEVTQVSRGKKHTPSLYPTTGITITQQQMCDTDVSVPAQADPIKRRKSILDRVRSSLPSDSDSGSS
jgi:competence protein ComGF